MPSISFKLHGRECTAAELARKLREAYPQVFHVSERSLGVYLGTLRQGKTGWWTAKPERAQAFCELTQQDPVDLDLVDERPSASSTFDHFPALRPLVWTDESLPDIYRDVELQDSSAFDPGWWLNPASGLQRANMAPGLYWLQVREPHDLDWLWRQLRAQGHAQCIETEKLERKALLRTASKPLVLRVSHRVDARDDLIHRAAPDSPVLVVSQHAPPAKRTAKPLVVGFVYRSLVESGSGLRGAMRRELRADWQGRLIQWMVGRVPNANTLLSPEDAQRWLEAALPYRSVVSTPNELIALCGLLHGRDRAEARRLHQGGGGALVRACIKHGDHARRFVKAVRHCYLHGSAPWNASMFPEQWGAHLEARTGPAPSVASLVTSLVEEKSLARRREAKAKLLTASAEAVLAELSGDGQFARCDDGSYQFDLPFVADAIAADEVERLVDAGDVPGWSHLYLDPSRRSAVEIALWRRSLSQLIRQAERVLAVSEGALIQISAEEALFWVIGLKLTAESGQGWTRELAILQALASRVCSRSISTGARPLTRDLQAPSEALTWITVCWNWSVEVPAPPGGAMVESTAWLFPGWALDEHLSDYVEWFLPAESARALADVGDEPGAAAWSMWWAVATRVVDRLSVVPAGLPDALKPAFLLAHASRGAPVEDDWVKVSGTARVFEQLLRLSIARLDAITKGRLLDALITTIAELSAPVRHDDRTHQQAIYGLKAVELAGSWFARDLVSSIDAPATLEIASADRFEHLLLCLGLHDDAVIRAFAQAVPQHAKWHRVFRQLLPFLPRQSWSTAASWLALYPSEDIAKWLWEEDALATLDLLASDGMTNEQALLRLAMTTPEEHIPAVADVLATTVRPLLRAHRAQWTLDHLPRHGARLAALVQAIAGDEWAAG